MEREQSRRGHEPARRGPTCRGVGRGAELPGPAGGAHGPAAPHASGATAGATAGARPRHAAGAASEEQGPSGVAPRRRQRSQTGRGYAGRPWGTAGKGALGVARTPTSSGCK